MNNQVRPTRSIWDAPEEEAVTTAPRPDDVPEDIPVSTGLQFTRGEEGLPPEEVFTEESFHADSQSITDSRTLSKYMTSAIDPEIARAFMPMHESDDRQLTAAEIMADAGQAESRTMSEILSEGEEIARTELGDGHFTKSTLDWLGTTRWNMVKTGELAFDVGSWSEEEQLALVRLMAQYEELPVSWETTKRAAKGLATDPTTYMGLSFVLSTLSKLALKPAAHAAVQSMLKTTVGAGTVGAVEVGSYMGVDNLLQQKIKIDTGQQKDYDLIEAGMFAAGGAVAGYSLIGGLTALVTRGAAKKSGKAADGVLDTTDEVVEQVDEVAEQVDEVATEVADEVDGTPNLLDDFNPEDAADEADWLAEMEAEVAGDFTDDEFDLIMSGVESEYKADANVIKAEDKPVKALPATTTMPKGLTGAKPRYNYGDTPYGIKFESDVDKALYIIAGKGKSKAHDDYMRFLRGVFPDKLEEEILEMGRTIKGTLKDAAKKKDADIDGDLVVDATFQPSKKPRRPAGESKANDPVPKVYDESKTSKMPYNVNRMETAKDVRSLVLTQVDNYLDENPRSTQTLAEVHAEGRAAAEELAEHTGGDFDAIVKQLTGDLEQQRLITARIKSTRDLHVWTFEELKRLAYKYRKAGLDDTEIEELVKITEMMNKLTPLTLDQAASQSRVLGSRRAMAISDDSLIRGGIDKEVGNTAADVLKAEAETILPVLDANAIAAIKNGNGPFVVKRLVDSIIDGIESGKIKGPKQARDAIQPPKIARIIAEVNRVRAGSMLGGITTMTLAAVSNHWNMVWQPALEYASRMNVGLTKAGRTAEVKLEDKLARTRALAQYSGNMQYYAQGWKTAMEAVKLGIHITDKSVTHLESSANQVGNKFKSRKRIIYENITGYAHTVLMALDEQHKFSRAHSMAFADAVVNAKRQELLAKKEGKTSFKEGSPEWKKLIEKDVAAQFDEHGGLINEAIMREVRMETYTEELVGPVGKFVNGVAGLGYGAGALVLPFRRAPVNSISYALQYAPLPEFITKHISAKQKQILQSGDAVQIAKLRARKKVGAMAIGYLWFTSDSGDMTGNGPTDWKMRKAWEAAGNKPYSIKINGTWVSYAKIEPFSTVMGSVANAHYIWKMNPEKYQDGTASVIEAIQMSVTTSILNKAYFQSINDWMKMITGEDNMTQTVLHGLVTSFVPNALNQFNQDPNVREATTVMEKVERKLAGMSEKLGAQYDVTGKPMLKPNDGWNLFKTPDVRADTSVMARTVFQEIFDLRVVQDKEGLLGEPPRNLSAGRVDYRDIFDAGETESVYAKYNRFIGETEIGGVSLEEALYDLITSDSYTNRPKSPYLDINSPHVALIAKVIKRYREKAKHRLMMESPAFHDRYESLGQRRHEVKRSRY